MILAPILAERLQSINLNGNHISPEGFSSIADSLKDSSKLQHFQIARHNNILWDEWCGKALELFQHNLSLRSAD